MKKNILIIKINITHKNISIVKYFFLYGLLGIIASVICALISTFAPCANKNSIYKKYMCCDYWKNYPLLILSFNFENFWVLFFHLLQYSKK